jgi:PAS domain S-box-containing protein
MKTVLLAYEREQDLGALETLLQARGHRVVKARSGLEALDAARGETPHVVVSDVLLPKLDGFTLCRRIKEDPLLQHLPVVLLSFRVEGPKYEAFAAEVGAERFFPRGSTLEDVATVVEEQSPGSGTMKMPALVPELIERREQDRRRMQELERRLKELESANRQLEAAERASRERADHASRERGERAASDAARIRDLQGRMAELEARQRSLADAEHRVRSSVEESKAGQARVEALEARLTELQSARVRAQAAAADAERAFASQPVPTWLSDMESQEIRAVSDSAAALFGITPEKLVGRPIAEVLPGFAPNEDGTRPGDIAFERADGRTFVLELRRQSVSYAGRACWLSAARDVTEERAERAAHQLTQLRALALDESPLATCLVDAQGQLRYANAAFRALTGATAESLRSASLRRFEVAAEGESTIRSLAIGGSGLMVREGQWRRADETVFDVETASAPIEGVADLRVVVVRDVSGRRRVLARAEREQRRIAELLEISQRLHSLTEGEILSQALELLTHLTHSAGGYVFRAVADAGHFELAAAHGDTGGQDLSVLTRWRGAPPAETALHQCVESQRVVIRDVAEGTGPLRQAGLPEMMRRQLCTPMLDSGRLVGVLLVSDKPAPYAEEDERHAVEVAEALTKLLHRRRSDAEVVSAMDHMERVMLGAFEALAGVIEMQDSSRSGRSRRVGDLAADIGTGLNLPGHTVRGLRLMGQLIDVGMLRVPREILWRPDRLTQAEYELVKTHPDLGFETLRRIEFPWPVAEVVRQHHERMDGSGYPRGLTGEEILLEARIVAVADAVEAMMSPRPQRAALSLAACLEELQSQAGRRYDARVVKACVKLLREREQRPKGEVSVGQRIA